jgi:hypothetical protein
MAIQFFVPGFGQVMEDGTEEYFIPGFGQFSEQGIVIPPPPAITIDLLGRDDSQTSLLGSLVDPALLARWDNLFALLGSES